MRCFKHNAMALVVALWGTALLTGSVSAQESNGKSKRWNKENEKIVLRNDAGAIVNEIELRKEERTLGFYPEHKFTEKELVHLNGGVSDDGRFAWTDRRESKWLLSGNTGSHLFRYFDQDGNVLWEKENVVGATLIQGGDKVGLLEANPVAIESLEYGNSFARPRIINSLGELVLDLTDCKTFSTAFPLSKNQRYGAFLCSALNPKKEKSSVLIFDVDRRFSERIDYIPQAGIEVRDDGTYTIFRSYQKYDPATKKYGDFVRETIRDGKIR